MTRESIIKAIYHTKFKCHKSKIPLHCTSFYPCIFTQNHKLSLYRYRILAYTNNPATHLDSLIQTVRQTDVQTTPRNHLKCTNTGREMLLPEYQQPPPQKKLVFITTKSSMYTVWTVRFSPITKIIALNVTTVTHKIYIFSYLLKSTVRDTPGTMSGSVFCVGVNWLCPSCIYQ